MPTPIDHLHHVAHVVADLAGGRALYERLGFSVPPPSYYAVPTDDGPPRYLGAANTHITFADAFVELIVSVDPDEAGSIPDDAKVTTVAAPPEMLERVSAGLQQAGAMIAAFRDRFEGVHILALHATDLDEALAALDAAQVGNTGINVAQRTVETPEGPKPVATRFIELDHGDPARPNLVPEGRIAVAESLAAELQHGADHLVHANGATGLVGAYLCTADGALAEAGERYERYLGVAPRADGPAQVFDLTAGAITLVEAGHLAEVLPGESAQATPGYAGYRLRVDDPAATRAFVEGAGFPTVDLPDGFLVPSTAVLGAAVAFGR